VLDLGEVPAGEEATAAVRLSFNDQGSAVLGIPVSGVPMIEVAGQGFLQREPSSCHPSAGLLDGASCSILVAFRPPTLGSWRGTLTVSGMPGGTVVATLVGTGVAGGTVAVSPPDRLDFASIVVDTQSAPRLITLTNSSTAFVNILDAELADSTNFGQTEDCTGPLAPGAACRIPVVFTPKSAGLKSTVFVVRAGVQRIAVLVTGTGLTP
jgi:hypothetical protein